MMALGFEHNVTCSNKAWGSWYSYGNSFRYSAQFLLWNITTEKRLMLMMAMLGQSFFITACWVDLGMLCQIKL